MVKLRLFTSAGPLFAAQGSKKIMDDDIEDTIIIQVCATYDEAKKKAVDLLYQAYHNISIYRLE